MLHCKKRNNKNTVLRKTVAIFLVMVMKITGTPTGLISSANAADEGIISVVKELTEYRGEFTKTFLKSNGELEAVVSAQPLHYKKLPPPIGRKLIPH